VEGFIDGKMVAQVKGIKFRTSADLKVNWLDFRGFFGGATQDWAPVKDEYNYYDDVMVYYYTSSSGQPIGNNPRPLGSNLPTINYPSSSVLSGSITIN
jgi:hypothetical protein